MDLLSRLEHVLEDVVEGVFSRAFRTQLQPIEVAKRLTREVENHRTISVSSTYVPNVYTVSLAPDTYATFQAISGRLLAELEQYLREFTTERQYQLVGPIAVRLAENPEVKAGEMQVTTANDAGAVPSSVPTPSVLRSYAAPAGNTATTEEEQERTVLISSPATALEITAGEGAGRTIPLTDGFTIGRGPINSLPLTDPATSRRHAEIVWEDDAWVLRDCGSTNGTYLNDHRITEHTLRPNDTIKIGGTVMKVK